MTPTKFTEANTRFGPPADLTEQQVAIIPGYQGRVVGGSMDGAPVVVTAWIPDERERALIAAGQPIYLSFIGGLPPHFPCMSFQEATNPA